METDNKNLLQVIVKTAQVDGNSVYLTFYFEKQSVIYTRVSIFSTKKECIHSATFDGFNGLLEATKDLENVLIKAGWGGAVDKG